MAKLRPLKAIRAKCLDCTNKQFIEIKECKIEKCPLWEYRMGRRPPKNVGVDFSPDNDADKDFIDEDILD